MREDVEALNAAMTEALYLSATDIETNRTGQISEAQMARVAGQMRAVWIGVSCLWLVTALPIVVVLFLLNNLILQGIVAIFTVIWLWGYVRAIFRIRAQHHLVRQDLTTGQAARTQGILKKRRAASARNYFFVVGELEFPVPDTLYEVAEEDREVIVYYLPQSVQILSMEYVAPDEDDMVFIEENQTI